MAEWFEDGKKPEKKPGLPEHVVNEVLKEQAHAASTQTAKPADSTSEDGYWTKHMKVVGNGLYYTGAGFVKGIQHDLKHPLEFGTKLVTAYATGMLFRRYLPEKGATKALAGTLMLGYFAWDALSPCVKAWQETTNAKTDADLDKASRKMGNGLGLWAFDSITGGIAGYKGDQKMASSLKSHGIGSYLAFEKARATNWSPENNPVERGLNRVATTLDGIFDKAAAKVRPAEPVPTAARLSPEETRVAIVKASKLRASNIEDSTFWRLGDKEPTLHTAESDTGFYRGGQQDTTGKRIGFDKTVDGYLGANKEIADNVPFNAPGAGQAPASAENPLAGKLGAKGIRGEHLPEPIDVRAPGDGGSGKPTAPKGSEGDVAVYDKVTGEAKKRMEALSELDIALAGYKDNVKGPLWGAVDQGRHVPLYEPPYEKPHLQLMAVADQLKTKEDVQQVGQLLEDHLSGVLQSELGVPIVSRLNLTGPAYKQALIEGMEKGNVVVPDFVRDMIPTKFSYGGDANYTQPHIFGVVDGAITKYPITQGELRGAFAIINGHEVDGHDHMFRLLSELTPEQVKTVIPQAVENAMRKVGISVDATVHVPGKGELKVIDVMTDIFIAQRNENTADIAAAARLATAPAEALIVLLKSLRTGNLLESRSVLGSRFPDFYEAHGVDRQRLILMAETIIERATNTKKAEDKAMLIELADQLKATADKVSRSGTNYVWASTDNKGEYLALPRNLVDAAVGELVKVQFRTPLAALKDKNGGANHTLNDIMFDLGDTVHKINFLADEMAAGALKGKDTLQVPFSPKDYWSHEVDAAGNLAWLRAVKKGGDTSKSIDHINLMWDGIKDQYLKDNPYMATTPPSTLQLLRQEPLNMARRALASTFGLQKWSREHTARHGGWLYGPMAVGLATGDTFHYLSPANNPENQQ